MSAHSITSRGLAGRKIPQGTLTPIGTVLFSGSEPCAWYDPSDLSTLFQDAAGTTPVTAAEQPVGRMLDKSGRGNHATQSTTTKRPVYSRRVNLLLKTEQFDHVSWSKSGATITANTGTAPDGASTADSVTFSSAADYVIQQFVGYTTTVGAQIVISLHVKSAIRLLYFGGATPAGTDIYTSTPLAGGWYLQKIVRTFTVTATGTPQYLFAGTNATGTFEVWGASITLATDAHLPYQWVNTATDYDADPAKFPAYLRFDGVDDALQTGNINFTSTDKMTVWAGVTKLSDVNASALLELSPNSSTSAGAIMLRAVDYPGAQEFTAYLRGSVAYVGCVAGAAASPATKVMTGLFNTSAPTGQQVTARLNGITGMQTMTGVGGGMLGDYPLYIGSRAGTTNFFNGRLYQLIVRGAQSSLSQIEATELYIKQKMRMP